MRKELLELKDKIVVVSKNRTLEQIRAVYDMGFRTFGENRVQELLIKQDNDMPDIHWHLIGHLQTNKVRQAVRISELIHSVDSVKLLLVINQEAARIGKIQDILLQVNIAEEETKYGFTIAECEKVMARYQGLSNVRIRGIMVIGPHIDDENRISEVFSTGKRLFDKLESNYQAVDILSMGMSNDYQIALKEGSSMLRLGHVMFEK